MTECPEYKAILMESGKRKQVREVLMSPELLDMIPVPEDATELKAALLVLPPQLSSVAILRVKCGMTASEIAEELKISKMTVYRRIKKAAILIKRLL